MNTFTSKAVANNYFRLRAKLSLYLCHVGQIHVKYAKNGGFAGWMWPAGTMLPRPDLKTL